jgi:cytochrome d ubiquinol oxidase subunit I
MFDIETLARFQFGMTTIFHFFFVPFSIGMTLVVTILEGIYVATGNEIYKKQAKFWGKIMLLSFAVGVVTGIIQEFQFGMNWSDYSRFVGDIFGAPLAVEALLAFFLESTFIGLWMFTWDKFGKKLHFICIFLVLLGSLFSSFWILIANSFMQMPGSEGVIYKLVDGRPQLNQFSALISNPQVWYQFAHVISGAIIMGGMALAGMCAFGLLRKKVTDDEVVFYKKAMRVGFTVLLIGSMAALISGDRQMANLIRDDGQQMKFAAMEGEYEDTGKPLHDGSSITDYENAPTSTNWTALAFFDESQHKKIWGLDIPFVGSILTFHRMSGAVPGMITINQKLVDLYGEDNYIPAVTVLFYSFRIMVATSMLFLIIGLIGFLGTTFYAMDFLIEPKWVIRVIAWCTFLPFVTNSVGWIITEVGRQPWIVFGLFKTRDAISPNVSASSLLVSNIVYFLLFTGLGAIMVYISRHLLRQGPQLEEVVVKESSDPFDKEAF